MKKIFKIRKVFERKRLFLLCTMVLSCGLAMFLVSCYPGDDITVNESDIVVTVFDQSADFSAKLTYARTPDVRVVSDPDQPDGDPTDLPPAVEQQILDSIDLNMAAMGFTPENPSDPTDNSGSPDVHVVAFVARTTWTGTGCWYYWDYWYPYPPGYGWCYPYAYTFTTGSVVIAMQDPAAPDQSQPLWVAGINGLVDNTTQSQILLRVSNAINQAFKQSPYLAAGK
jgi:hypothetical protein